jgi:histone acetyltransferase
LIFDNCRKYNNDTTPYAKCANKLEKYMWAQIKTIPEWSHLEP